MSVLLENPRAKFRLQPFSRMLSRFASLRFIAGFVILVTLLVSTTLVSLVSPYGPDDLVAIPLEPPSMAHFFGTDALGRDVFTRVFVAARIDLFIVLAAIIPPAFVGTLIGAAVAFSGRKLPDLVLLRITDAIVAFPFLVLVLVIAVLVGAENTALGAPPGVIGFLIAVYGVSWAFYARIGRAEVLSIRTREFILAARVLGYSPIRICFRHILPLVFGTSLTLAISDMVSVVAALAGLSFLGAGVQPPTAEWGAMMYEGKSAIESAWWVVAAPAAALLVTAIALMLIGEALIRAQRRDS